MFSFLFDWAYDSDNIAKLCDGERWKKIKRLIPEKKHTWRLMSNSGTPIDP